MNIGGTGMRELDRREMFDTEGGQQDVLAIISDFFIDGIISPLAAGIANAIGTAVSLISSTLQSLVSSLLSGLI